MQKTNEGRIENVIATPLFVGEAICNLWWRSLRSLRFLMTIPLTLILVILNSFQHPCIAQDQEYTRTLNLSQWVDEMLNTEEGSYELENAVIKPDYDGIDSIYINVTRFKIAYGKDSTWVIMRGLQVSDLTFEKSMVFRNCKFLDMPFIKRCVFERAIGFYQCKVESDRWNAGLHFVNSEFRNGLYFGKSIINGPLDLTSCKITHTGRSLTIKDCSIERISLDSVYFTADTSLIEAFRNLYKSNLSFLDIRSSQVNNIHLEYIDVPDDLDSSIYSISIKDTRMENLEVTNCPLVRSFVLMDAEVSRNLLFHNIPNIELLMLSHFTFPKLHTNMSWEMIDNGRISVQRVHGKKPYRCSTDEDLQSSVDYSNLISTYNGLYAMYKTRGDRRSANGCYVEMKDIETRRLGYLCGTKGGKENYFNWRLNQFLKLFCDYGTSPIKSLIMSLYVVFGFAGFYFFFYSDWDRISRKFLVDRYRNMMQWFLTEQSTEDFYSELHREDIVAYQTFKTVLDEGRIRLPLYFRWLGTPLYRLSLLHHNISAWFYRRTEILSGTWDEQSQGRQRYVALVSGIGVAGYIIYLLAIRSINSLFLSINTFSTLGFGEIPVRGISRYMTILEGFIGWFLLSIFSVSLISQILQN